MGFTVVSKKWEIKMDIIWLKNEVDFFQKRQKVKLRYLLQYWSYWYDVNTWNVVYNVFFQMENFCWPFGQHLLTKFFLKRPHKKAVFGYNWASKDNGAFNMGLGCVLGLEKHSTIPNLQNVSRLDRCWRPHWILRKVDFWEFWLFTIF